VGHEPIGGRQDSPRNRSQQHTSFIARTQSIVRYYKKTVFAAFHALVSLELSRIRLSL
jgi:hypothetical protein